MRAEEVMNRNVICASLPDNRENVLELFKKYGISAVPVLKDGKLAGIVTRKDILRKVEENQLVFLMTPNPVTVQASDSLETVVDIFLSTHFRRLPVLDGDELVGIITIRDLIKKIAEADIETPVEKFITNTVVCVWEETPLSVVGEVMRLSNAEFCPVLNSDAEVVGVVDEKIMLTETLIEEFLEHTEYSSSSDTDDAWAWDGVRDYAVKYFEVSVVKLPKEPVKKFMKEPVFVYPHTSVSKAAKELVKNDVDYLPVLDVNNRLIGLIPDKNLISVLLDVQKQEGS